MPDIRSVLLVEGVSDQAAVETLAKRLGRDLKVEGVSIVAMGGASAIGDFLEDLMGSQGFDMKLSGLCDEAEMGDFRRGLERVGFGTSLSKSEMESLGFYTCSADLEDELIRALGVKAVLEVFDAEGELRGFRKFQNQVVWRGRPLDEQVHRFIGIKAGRKVRYGRLLVDALNLSRVPRPLVGVLDHV